MLPHRTPDDTIRSSPVCRARRGSTITRRSDPGSPDRVASDPLPSDAVALAARLLAAALLAAAVTGCRGRTEDPIGAREAYARVAPSVAYIETVIGSGSGLLLDERHVVTNAHVVWPYDDVRVAFADGTAFEAVPVTARDLMADLALLELPTAVDLPPAPIGDPDALQVGDDVYQVGYPGEVEALPQPAVSRGVLSRRRTWAPAALDILQSDAALAGGQSGGALVDGAGTVVGLTDMLFGEAAFGLSWAMDDVLARLTQLQAGQDIDQLTTRRVPLDGGRRQHEVTLDHFWDEAVFVATVPPDTEIELLAQGPGDPALTVYDPYGTLELELDEDDDDDEIGEVVTFYDGPYFVVLTAEAAVAPHTLTLRAGQPLAPLDDPDDGQTLTAGDTVTGHLDFPGDIDHFHLMLERGQPVTLEVDTLAFPATLVIERPEDPDAGWVSGEVDGRSPLGFAVSASFTAPAAGRYVVAVYDNDALATGGYYLSVR